MPTTEADTDPEVIAVLWEAVHHHSAKKLRLVETRAMSGSPNLRLELDRPVGKKLHIPIPGVFVDEITIALDVFRRHRRKFLLEKSSGR